MSLEGQLLDWKSLHTATREMSDWNEIAKHCIAFANAMGMRLPVLSTMADTAWPIAAQNTDHDTTTRAFIAPEATEERKAPCQH